MFFVLSTKYVLPFCHPYCRISWIFTTIISPPNSGRILWEKSRISYIVWKKIIQSEKFPFRKEWKSIAVFYVLIIIGYIEWVLAGTSRYPQVVSQSWVLIKNVETSPHLVAFATNTNWVGKCKHVHTAAEQKLCNS